MLNIKVKTKDFLRAIRVVENAIEDDKLEGKNSGLYIETKENKLEFRGIGFNLFIKCECDATIIQEGSIILKHKLVEEFLRKVQEDFIEIKEEEKSIVIYAKDTVARYALLEYEAPTELGIVNGVEYIFDKKVLSEAIETTQFAVSTDTANTRINCIKFDINDKNLILVSTDSYRLMYRDVEMVENVTNENISVNIPLKIIQALLKIFKESNTDNIVFKSEGTRVLFKLDDIQILTKVAEIQFPSFESLIKEKSDENIIKINKNELQLALEKVQVFIKDKKERKNVAQFNFSKEELKVSGAGDYGSTSSNIFISNENSVELKMYLNVKFILDYLYTIKNSDIIEMRIINPLAAIKIKEDKKHSKDIYVTMPLKV